MSRGPKFTSTQACDGAMCDWGDDDEEDFDLTQVDLSMTTTTTRTTTCSTSTVSGTARPNKNALIELGNEFICCIFLLFCENLEFLFSNDCLK